MNLTFLPSSSPSRRLVLFFAGWGMSPHPFQTLTAPGYEIAVIWDYTDCNLPSHIIGSLSGYEEIAVVAWSFGVAAASGFIQSHPDLPFTAKIAINGTQHPVDDRLGIPATIYERTLDNLSSRSVDKFHMRMCGGASATSVFLSDRPRREVGSLREELRAIGARSITILKWDLACISDTDRIIPPANQYAAWAKEACATVSIPGPHLPDIQSLLCHILTDKQLVAERFGAAASTYDSEATIQRIIASRLVDLAYRAGAPTGADILEIGCGTGLATKILADRLSPRSLTLWDLSCPSEPPTLPGSPPTAMAEGDAETMIRRLPDNSMEMVFSSSTVQWFNSLPAFLAEIYRVLRPGGIAAISTFGPRTMHEIHLALGTESRFPDIGTIRRAIPTGLTVHILTEETETITFPSPLDILRHIRRTGVNSLNITPSPGTLMSLIRHYPTGAGGVAPLSYHPIYLIATK